MLPLPRLLCNEDGKDLGKYPISGQAVYIPGRKFCLPFASIFRLRKGNIKSHKVDTKAEVFLNVVMRSMSLL